MTVRRLSPAVLGAIAVLPMLAIAPFRSTLPDLALLTAFTVATVVALLIGGLAWSRLDETAREAHKSAWFWGAGAGLMILLVALAAVLLVPGGKSLLDGMLAALRPAEAPWSSEAAAFSSGVLAAGIMQSVTYSVVWGVWWLRRR